MLRVSAFMTLLFKYTNSPPSPCTICGMFVLYLYRCFSLFLKNKPHTTHMNLLNERHRMEENEAFNKQTCFPAKWGGTPLNIYFPINPTSFFLSTTIFIRVNEIPYLQLGSLCVACLSFKEERWFFFVLAVFSSQYDYARRWILNTWGAWRFSETTILYGVWLFCKSVQITFFFPYLSCLLHFVCLWNSDMHFGIF